jgi:hypothetical protein
LKADAIAKCLLFLLVSGFNDNSPCCRASLASAGGGFQRNGPVDSRSAHVFGDTSAAFDHHLVIIDAQNFDFVAFRICSKVKIVFDADHAAKGFCELVRREFELHGKHPY